MAYDTGKIDINDCFNHSHKCTSPISLILPGQLNGQGGGGGGTSTSESFRYFYHPDHLGSTSYVTDASGEVYQHLEYFAFGETFVEEHSNTDRTPYLFNGKELDEETGLYYYGARYMDPRTSVWLSVDPMADQSGMSPFAFSDNNPIALVDPDGNQAEPYVRLVFWGGARKKGDNSAFFFASRNVINDYGSDGNIKNYQAKSGSFVVNKINAQKDNSIQSVDFFTHGSQYALYMVQDKETGTNSSTSTTIPEGNVQENNLYASKAAQAFQSWGGGQETSTINSIDFNKFTNDAKIEIHGCKSAAGTFMIDNLGINLSEALYNAGKTRSIVIAHADQANPNINGGKTTNKGQDYRHGTRVVFHNGKELFRTNEKGRIKASTIKKHLDAKLNE